MGVDGITILFAEYPEIKVRRPTHGEFDLELAAALGAAASGGNVSAARALGRQASQALRATACRPTRVAPLLPLLEAETPARLSLAPDAPLLAVEVAEAICEALGVGEVLEGALLAAAGVRLGQCARHLVGEDGEIVAPRAPGAALERCAYGCAGSCLIEDGVPVEAQALVRDWRRCGGATRHTWPRSGGLDAQDAVTVWAFGVLDAAAEHEARRLIAARPALARGA